MLASGAAKHLRTLDLAGNALGDLGIGKLVGVLRGGACPGLTRLSLRDNGFGADGAACLAGLSAPTGRGGRRVFGPPLASSHPSRTVLMVKFSGHLALV